MTNVFVMVGIPGSGKSTFAKKLTSLFGAKIFSYDAVCTELFGETTYQENSKQVFDVLLERALDAVNNKNNVIIDACNVTVKDRKRVFDTFKNVPDKKIIAYTMDTPLEQCKARNQTRDDKVSEEVIDKMHNKYQAPSMNEGFDEIYPAGGILTND